MDFCTYMLLILRYGVANDVLFDIPSCCAYLTVLNNINSSLKI